MKIRSKIVIWTLMLLCTVFSAMATCTVSFAKFNYSGTETMTANAVCDAVNEQSQAYLFNWTNSSLDLVQAVTGTTPAVKGTHFYSYYLIPAAYLGEINVSLTGTNLEGKTAGNVTGTPLNALLITNISVDGKWMGLSSSTHAVVKNYLSKKITGAVCHVHVLSNDQAMSLINIEERTINGEAFVTGPTQYTEFKELTDYVVEWHCYCGLNNTVDACVDENGLTQTNLVGDAKFPFTLHQWVNFTDNMDIAFANGTLAPANEMFFAGFGESVYWQSNKTNNYNSNLVDKVTNFIVNNVSGLTPYYENSEFTLKNNETVSRLRSMSIPKEVPTGIYYVRQYHDIYYQDILVAEYIMKTKEFNVTGTADSFKVNNVVLDKQTYYTGETISICVNWTSTYDTREEFDINYRYRCGNTSSTTFSIIDSFTETRAFNSNDTQLRCADMIIPYADLLKYKTSSCQAVVTIQSPFISTYDNKIAFQDNNTFNITDFGMYPRYDKDPGYPMIKLFPDWRRFDDLVDGISKSYYRAKINISQLNENKLDPTDLINNASWDIYAIFSDDMPALNEIYNYSVEYVNGSPVSNEVEEKAMQWMEKQGITYPANRPFSGDKTKNSLGIENVNLSNSANGYFVIKVWFEDLAERSTKALENMSTFNMNMTQTESAALLENRNLSNYQLLQVLALTNTNETQYKHYLEFVNQSRYAYNLSYLAYLNLLEQVNQSNSLWDIANKTGTFHFGVNCPPTGEIGNTLTCRVDAQIEDASTTPTKEVDFTCYVINDLGENVAVKNWNSMVSYAAPYHEWVDFLIPSEGFTDNEDYTVRCDMSYYNLGSRTDNAIDTFTADKTIGAGIAGFMLDMKDNLIEMAKKNAMTLAGIMIVGGLLLCLVLPKKKVKKTSYFYEEEDEKLK